MTETIGTYKGLNQLLSGKDLEVIYEILEEALNDQVIEGELQCFDFQIDVNYTVEKSKED